MAKTGYLSARIDPALKQQADEVLARLGLTTTGAITLFLHQVVAHNGLPFEVRAHNGGEQASAAPERRRRPKQKD